MNKIKYVGYGESVERALSHQSESHNAELKALIDEDHYLVEIAGPFGTADSARAVEAALISVLQPSFNILPGPAAWRFRPCGVPLGFVNRLQEQPLTRDDLLENAKSILFVRNTNRTFNDGRVGYDPANLPTDAQILEQLTHWWQLGQYVSRWQTNPEDSPEILVGVYGKPTAQIIIGALNISKNQWKSAKQESNGSRYSVPTDGPKDLDANGWRGRRIDAGVGLKFSNIRHEHFRILKTEGIIGGRRPGA